jgi:flavodoxin
MKALIVYSSWFGHNRRIARLIAAELARRNLVVVCAPAARIAADDLDSYDLLVLGTGTHAGRASKRLRALCTAIPLRQFERLEIGLFGARIGGKQPRRQASGVEELKACLAERGCELALPPLVIELQGAAALLPWLGIGAAERAMIAEFAADLWEASVPEPMI